MRTCTFALAFSGANWCVRVHRSRERSQLPWRSALAARPLRACCHCQIQSARLIRSCEHLLRRPGVVAAVPTHLAAATETALAALCALALRAWPTTPLLMLLYSELHALFVCVN
jgi:hypothetical protein